MPATIQSEAEATRQCNRLRGQNSEFPVMSIQPSLAGSRLRSRLSSRVQRPSNTPPAKFLYSVAETVETETTPTQEGKSPEIQILEPTPMKPLTRLSADPDSEEPQAYSESEPPSPHVKQAVKHLKCLYQKLYPSEDSKEFADGWQAFAEITEAIDRATKSNQPVILGQFPVAPQTPPSSVPTLQDPPFASKKPCGICVYAKDFVQSLSPTKEIYQVHHPAAMSSSSTAPQHKLWFPVPTVVPWKPQVPPAAAAPALTIFTRPITPVTASAQPTCRPSSTHTTPAAQPLQNVSSSQPAT